jgi:hypothetical protein
MNRMQELTFMINTDYHNVESLHIYRDIYVLINFIKVTELV